jgi:hypothetical protein
LRQNAPRAVAALVNSPFSCPRQERNSVSLRMRQSGFSLVFHGLFVKGTIFEEACASLCFQFWPALSDIMNYQANHLGTDPMNTTTHNERRAHVRKEVLAPAVMRFEVNGKSYVTHAIVRDLSAGGLLAALYEFDEDLMSHDLDEIKGNIQFRLSDTGKEYCVACQAKRARKLQHTIQVGTAFTGLSPRDQQELQQYCY